MGSNSCCPNPWFIAPQTSCNFILLIDLRILLPCAPCPSRNHLTIRKTEGDRVRRELKHETSWVSDSGDTFLPAPLYDEIVSRLAGKSFPAGKEFRFPAGDHTSSLLRRVGRIFWRATRSALRWSNWRQVRVSDAASGATTSDGATSARCVICQSAASVASRQGRNLPENDLASCVVALGARTRRMNGGLARPTRACGGGSGAVSHILWNQKRSFPGAQNRLRQTLF
jgi:hypothetical protein